MLAIKTPHRSVLVAALMLLAGCSAWPQWPGYDGSAPLQQGLSAGRAGDFQKMATLCRTAAGVPAADPLAFKCVADAQTKLGNRNEAEAGYQAYLDRAPADADARIRLAGLMLDNDRFQAAQRQLERVIAQNPNLVEGQYLLGEAFRKQKKCRPAMDHYAQALAINSGFTPALEGKARAQQEICKGMGIQ